MVENAIQQLMERYSVAVRGKTASPEHSYYRGVCQAAEASGGLRKCECGQKRLGWVAEEYIANLDGKTWSVHYDATTNKISCGPNGYHSARYSDTPGWDD